MLFLKFKLKVNKLREKMAPSPQAPSLSKMDPAALNGDAVVISGMSGMYPEARNIQELSDILYNKVHTSMSNARSSLQSVTRLR